MININWSLPFSLLENNICDETMTSIILYQKTYKCRSSEGRKAEKDFKNIILRKNELN